MIKFFDLIGFKEIFDFCYIRPQRDPKLRDYLMFVGILMLLFIGFNRLWQFIYIRLDAMLCGFFRLTRLPVASTFWRYVDSLGINQANSLFTRLRAAGFTAGRWRIFKLAKHCGFNPSRFQIYHCQ